MEPLRIVTCFPNSLSGRQAGHRRPEKTMIARRRSEGRGRGRKEGGQKKVASSILPS